MADFSGLAWVGLDQHWVLQAGPGFDCTVLSKKDPMLQSIECSLGLHQAVVRAQPVDWWVIIACWLLESDCLEVLYYTWVFFLEFLDGDSNSRICLHNCSFFLLWGSPASYARFGYEHPFCGRGGLGCLCTTVHDIEFKLKPCTLSLSKAVFIWEFCNSGCGVFIFAWIFKIILWK